MNLNSVHALAKGFMRVQRIKKGWGGEKERKKVMEGQEIGKEKIILETLTPEQPKTRKRKLLTDLGRIQAKCKVCLEVGNSENLIRHQLPVKNLVGVVLHGAFSYVYFCSENCRGLFSD